MPSNKKRHDRVHLQLERFRAHAEHNAREQQFGQMAYAYSGSLGEWLGTAVQIAASVSWQAHWALRPLERQDAHEPIAEQGRGFIELYGAVLVGALGACDAALDREVAADVQVELPAVDSGHRGVGRGSRRARRSPLLAHSPRRRDLDLRHLQGPRRPAPANPLATKLLEATGYAALALAVADEEI